MDVVDRLFGLFEDPGAATAWKFDALLDLGQRRDPRVDKFLLRILSDREQPSQVRVAIIRLLRDSRLSGPRRCDAARVLADTLETSSGADCDLRAQAAVALGDLVDEDGALGTLGDRAADPHDDFEVRYAAFTSLERAGPTTESIDILTQLRTDETFGRSAQSILVRWRVEK
jgi:HEAT repeat protein